MKSFLLVIPFVIMFSIGIAQTLPAITAIAGRGQNVDWQAIQKEEDADKDGPGFFYHDCAQGVEVVSASSELKGQGAKNYSVKNLSDEDPMTAWVEGKPGYGIGESFSVKAIKVNTIYNGYQSSPLNWKNNSRVKKFKVYLDNKALCYLILKDEMGEQNFELPFDPDYNKYHLFKFEIADVYKGIKWDDVAISHVDHNGCCVGEETMISFGETDKVISEMDSEEKILCIDLKKENTFYSTVTRVVKQVHLSLLVIKTDHHQIRVTPDHPLFIKDVGFSSLSRMKTDKRLTNYESLAGELELMLWDDSKKRMYSEKIISIQSVQGEFKTYTLKGLPEGAAYVANGFVMKSY